MVNITKLAPAKVNLALLIGPKEETGLHEVFTVFVPVDVYDELEFALEAKTGGESPGELRVECRTANGEANLAAQALRSLERLTGWRFSGRVTIHKSIPVGAGMGGGSSDAAMALLVGVDALAEAGGPVPDEARLRALARQLGADVPFFLDPFPAIGRGIGEFLAPLDLPEFSMVLVFFDRQLSTARVYRTFDAMRPGETQVVFQFRANQAEKRWRQLVDASQMARLLENDLEQASFSLIPSLGVDREIVAREGALGAIMSGSGPTLVGVCESGEKAEELKDRMTIRGFSAQVATVLRGTVEE